MPTKSIPAIHREADALLDRIGVKVATKRVVVQGVDAEGRVTASYLTDGTQVDPTDDDCVFQIVDAILPALIAPTRYAVAASGRSAGKSHGAARWVLALALSESCRILVARESLMSLSESMYALLRDIIFDDPYLAEAFEVQRDRILCRISGSEILFKGLRRDRIESSVKSIERIRYCVVEESQTVSRVSLRVLRPSIRDEGSRLIFLLNPRYIDDAIHEDFIQIEREDTTVVRFTFKDNPWVPQVMLDEARIDYRNNAQLAAHVWGGELAVSADELVFNNWIIESFDEAEVIRELLQTIKVPPNLTAREKRFAYSRQAQRIESAYYTGFDHGWIHPSAGVELYYDPKHKRIFVCRELYGVRMKLESIAPKLQEAIPRAADGWPVVVDSARPDVIDLMRRGGIKARPSTKIPIAQRLDKLQSHLFVVHPRCQNFIRELSSYRWQKDRNDNLLPTPVKENDHLLDAASYALAGELQSRPVAGYEQLRSTFQ